MPKKHGSSCPFCRKIFTYAGSLDTHLRNVHSGHAHSFFHNSAISDPEALHQSQEDEYEEEEYEEQFLHVLELEQDTNEVLQDGGLRDSDLESASSDLEEDEPPPEQSGRTSREFFEGAGDPHGDVEGYAKEETEFLTNPWKPFNNATEFKLAHFFLRSNTTLGAIDSFFRDSLGPSDVSYHSARSFRQLLGSMDTTLGVDSWYNAEVTLGGTTIPYYYRSPLNCIQYLLRQRAYKKDMVYGPERWFDDGERQYGELHTADWWWDMQVGFASPSPRKGV
jgi:Plavaka transposase